MVWVWVQDRKSCSAYECKQEALLGHGLYTEKSSMHIGMNHKCTPPPPNHVKYYIIKVTQCFTSATEPKFMSIFPLSTMINFNLFFNQVYRMTPQCPHTCYTSTPSPQFQSLYSSMASHFRVAGHYKTSAPNDPKMTLNTKRLKVPHMIYIYILQLLPAPMYQPVSLYG